MKTPIIVITVAVSALVIAYLGYDLLRPTVNRCETVFEQTSVTLGAKLKLIETEGEVLLGRERVQELGERAQETALHLKTCCIALDSGAVSSDQFLQCQQTAKSYVERVGEVASSVEQASVAKAEGRDEELAQQIARIEVLLQQARERSQELDEMVRTLPQSAGGVGPTPGPSNGAEPGTLRVTAALAAGGAPVESCFDVYEAAQDIDGNRRYVSRSCGKTALFTLDPGTYFVQAQSGNAGTADEITVRSAEVIDEAFDLNAGYLRTKAALAEGSEAVESCFDVYEAQLDVEGNRPYVSRSCGQVALFTLPVGHYYATATTGNASAAADLEISADQLLDQQFDLNAGYLRVKAGLAEGAGPLQSCVDVYGAEQDLLGNRKYVHRSCGESMLFTLPAGVYFLQVSSGDASTTLETAVQAAQLTDQMVSLNAGYLRARAVLSEGMPPLEGCFDVYDAKEDLQGNRRYINRACGGPVVFILAAGSYYVQASNGLAQASQVLDVKANEVLDRVMNLNAGTLRLRLGTVDAEVPAEACFDIYMAKQDLQGDRTYLDRRCGSEAVFTINAGDYFIVAQQGDRQASREAAVAAGQETDLAIELGQ
ncbi:MAG: hypothetical protein ACFCUQ_12455 [Kiloniellales bacterium]